MVFVSPIMQAVDGWSQFRKSKLFKNFQEFNKFFGEILLRTRNNVHCWLVILLSGTFLI